VTIKQICELLIQRDDERKSIERELKPLVEKQGRLKDDMDELKSKLNSASTAQPGPFSKPSYVVIGRKIVVYDGGRVTIGDVTEVG